MAKEAENILSERYISISLLINADISGQLFFDILIGGMFFLAEVAYPAMIHMRICIYTHTQPSKFFRQVTIEQDKNSAK
jgi:hypothetical protein